MATKGHNKGPNEPLNKGSLKVTRKKKLYEC